MQLKVRRLKFYAGRPIAIISQNTADKMNVHVGERVTIRKGRKEIISIVDTATGLIQKNEIAISNEIVKSLNLKGKEKVEVSLAREPESTILIHKKLDCQSLSQEELKIIINDIVQNALTETEIAYFVSSVYKCGMSMKEIEYMIKAIVETGKRLKLKGKIVDKHSIGGIAGNRTTPIVVSICAAAGLIMPKNSSRAITSAAGTADVLESITGVEFSLKDVEKIIKKTGACLVWGGALGLSPADDKIIQIERILNLDPEPQLLASVLSKKISVGSKYVLIDIPYGKGAKVDKKRGMELKRKFETLAKQFNIKLKCVLTDGRQPIGNGIGPLLEIRDILSILKRDNQCPKDLEKKSIYLAARIFELCGKTKKGKGQELAKKMLDSGKAFEKFKQIIIAQGGKIPSETQLEKRLAKYRYDIYATKNSKIKYIGNKRMNLMATIAGSPMDNGAGLYLYKHLGNKIKKGDKLLTIYSESKIRIKDALNFYNKNKPIGY